MTVTALKSSLSVAIAASSSSCIMQNANASVQRQLSEPHLALTDGLHLTVHRNSAKPVLHHTPV